MFARRTFYYGWVVVAACAGILAASSGARFSFGVFLKPFSEAEGWDRAALSFAITINLVLGGALQPVVGTIVDRVGARVIGAAGIALLGLSFVGLSSATELWQVYLYYGVLGAFGVAATSSILSAALVGSWFYARRGLAMAFSSSGTAIGQLLVVPFATWTMLRFGYSGGFIVIALLALSVAPLAWLLIRDRPDGHETSIDDRADRAIPRRLAREGAELGVVLRSPIFWQLSFGLMVCGVTMSFPSTHLMPYAMDMHMPELVASSALGMAGALSFPAGLAIGWLADRHGRGRLLALVYALRGLTYLILLNATDERTWYLAAFVLGLSWTGTVPLSSAIAADAFGQKHLGLITGLMVMGMWIAMGIAAFVAGLIFDRTHSYTIAMIANGLLGFAAASTCLAIANERLMPYAGARISTAPVRNAV